MLPSADFGIPSEEADDVLKVVLIKNVRNSKCLGVKIKDLERIDFKRAKHYIDCLRPSEEISKMRYHPKLLDYISNNFRDNVRGIPYDKLPIELEPYKDGLVVIRHLLAHDKNLYEYMRKYCYEIEADKAM